MISLCDRQITTLCLSCGAFDVCLISIPFYKDLNLHAIILSRADDPCIITHLDTSACALCYHHGVHYIVIKQINGARAASQ